MNKVIPHEPSPPASLNLGRAFDLSLPLSDRSEVLMQILSLAAELTVRRDEEDNPDAYTDPEFRQQEIRRRTLKGIEDLRQASNMMELRWAMDNGHETWVDADGAEVSLLDTIEGQMPSEEQRKSSGRARELWMFVAGKNSAVAAFREQGIPDQEIAKVNTSGMSSVLGIVATYRKKIEEAMPPDELHEIYRNMIQIASEATNLGTLEKTFRQMLDPTDTPPPPIPYSVEADNDQRWVVMYPTNEQFRSLILGRLKDVLEPDNQLPEWFVRYWSSFSSVPAGQGE